MNSIPASEQASISLSLMARDASEMSVSPAQNFLNPSPVPGPSTLIPTSGCPARNASALIALIGSTVDDPEMMIDPDPASESSDAAVVSPAAVVSLSAEAAVLSLSAEAAVLSLSAEAAVLSLDEELQAAAIRARAVTMTASHRIRAIRRFSLFDRHGAGVVSMSGTVRGQRDAIASPS
jgi:hypothetical protein